MADDVNNKIKIIDGIINSDEIDSPQGQYQKWRLQEFTNTAPDGFLKSKRGCYFNVFSMDEATAILDFFRAKKCSIADYTGDRKFVTRIYFWHL